MEKAGKIRGVLRADWAERPAGQALRAELARLARSRQDIYLCTDEPASLSSVLPESCLGSIRFVPFGAALTLDSRSIWCGVYAPWLERNVWIHYEGEKGAATAAGLFGLDTKTAKGFRAFVENFVRCQECGRPATARYGKKKRVFLACSGYPSCSWRALVTKEVVEVFLTLAERTCPLCGAKLVARLGRSGVFAGCSRFPQCRGSVSLVDLL